MKRLFILIMIIVIVALSYKGYGYIRKFRNAKKLKIGIDNFKIPKLNLKNLLTSITAKLDVVITNFSKSVYQIDQISVDVLSVSSGELIAEQQIPLNRSVSIAANQKTSIPLTFDLSAYQISELIKLAGGVVSVGANFLTTGSYGIPLHLKGFVEAEGFTIDIDEKIIL